MEFLKRTKYMNYQILARKYRPQSFEEVIGQKYIVKAISNGFDLKRVHHTWLLSGTRGVGKTTIARIIAKSLNCKTGITSLPCRKCNICQEIEKGICLDFIEIDAASRTKVEEIREILDNIYYSPSKSRFKIYLIDEVHMLSKHSFNALLKTLEEPPKHAKFILATTDVEKVPKTIISRCLYFKLNILSEEDIFNFIKYILEKEGSNFDEEALKIISYHANGSMRDALNLLEHALHLTKNNINLKKTTQMLGIPSKKNAILLTKFLLQKDSKKMMNLLNKISKIGSEWQNILIEMLHFLHHIAMLKSYPKIWNETFIKNNEKEIEKIVKNNSKHNIQLCYQILLNGKKDLFFAPNHKMAVEMTLLQAITEIKK